MLSIVPVQLDAASRKRLRTLVRELGWSPSRVVREGLRLLEACRLPKKRRKIIGLGKFSSGIGDLSYNKEHLKDFGK